MVGATGASGTNGTNGLDGKTIISGTASPSTEGVDGDFYIDTDDNLIYGPKTGGAWGSGTSLVGPAGADAALSGTGDPNGSVIGVAGQLYLDTVTGILYKTTNGTTWISVDEDNQDISLTGNIISITKSTSTVDLGNSTLASDVSTNAGNISTNTSDLVTLLASVNRINNIRVVKNPTVATAITNNDGTVIIEQTGLLTIGVGANITIPEPTSTNLGNKLTIVNRAGNGTLLGLSVSLNLNVSGGSTIQGSLLTAVGLSVLGTNSSMTIQCGYSDPVAGGNGNYYWYQIDSALLGL